MDARRVAPPSGQPPPERAGDVDLVALALEACTRYAGEYPDERERYGEDVAMAWCRHDLQHLLNWAIADVRTGHVDLVEQVAWLAGVLHARDFPLDRLARGLEIAADVVTQRHGDEPVAARLREAAASVAVPPEAAS